MKLLARLATVGALVLASFAVVVGATAAPASAATCIGYSCHGHDPDVYGCSRTSTVRANAVDHDGAVVAWVENLYSAGCVANWARAQLHSAGLARGYRIYVEITTTDSRGNFEDMCYPGPSNTGNLIEDCTNWPTGGYGGSSVIYTDMVDGTNVTHAYVWVHDAAGNLVAWTKADQ